MKVALAAIGGHLLLGLWLAQSLRFAVGLTERLGAPLLAPAAWAALLGLAAWAVTEGLSACGLLTHEGLFLSWTLLLVALSAAPPTRAADLRRTIAETGEAVRREGRSAWIALAAVAFVLTATLLTGLVSPPNNWDSMTYHNPQVMQWLHRGSIEHYATSVDRQLRMPALASFFRLQIQGLTGSDVLFNSVQWLFFVVSIAASGCLALILGERYRAALMAVVFAATLPMAILQASSTQNDLVVAGYAVSGLMVVVHLHREPEGHESWRILLASLCSGLAAATKGTGYILAVLLLAAGLILSAQARRFRRRALAWAVGVVLALALNAPHLARNIHTFGGPLPHPEAVAASAWRDGTTSLKRLASQVWRGGMSQLQPFFGREPTATALDAATRGVHSALRISAVDPTITWTPARGVSFLRQTSALHEDTAGNPAHFVLALAATAFALFRPGRQRPAVLALLAFAWLSWTATVVGVKWMPWHSRLQLPALVLLAAPVACMLGGKRGTTARDTFATALIVGLAGASLPWVLFNASRPLVSWPGRPSVVASSRWDDYFRNRPELKPSVEAVLAALPPDCSPARPVGLRIGGHQWEYAFWAGARRWQRDLRFEHVLTEPPPPHLCALITDRCAEAFFCLAAR